MVYNKKYKKKQGCNCSKSNCQRNYCECFSKSNFFTRFEMFGYLQMRKLLKSGKQNLIKSFQTN